MHHIQQRVAFLQAQGYYQTASGVMLCAELGGNVSRVCAPYERLVLVDANGFEIAENRLAWREECLA